MDQSFLRRARAPFSREWHLGTNIGYLLSLPLWGFSLLSDAPSGQTLEAAAMRPQIIALPGYLNLSLKEMTFKIQYASCTSHISGAPPPQVTSDDHTGH